ncbi:mucin-5AC-like [Culex pipiens pallens]|uniref:mucin-5AC-like n=1 Tax=Culex pipiens pallens TaxID=42434 RepID=UPI0022AADE0D|nr:mucin-5AC-like [Culex pipiens pallens]
MWSTAILLAAFALLTSAQNDFDAILGCKQYTITGPSYKNPNPYFALDEFQNVLDVEVAGLKIRTIRLGVMGSNDGVIRLAPVEEPYQNTMMDEIVISGWKNTRNAVRQYVRSSPSKYSKNVILVNQLSGGILSPNKPYVFTLSIVNDHLVTLSNDGEVLPFLQYTDTGVLPKYIGFSNWNSPVSVFYDCPPPTLPTPPTTQSPATTTAAPILTSSTAPETSATATPVLTTTEAAVSTTPVDPVSTTPVAPVESSTSAPVSTTTETPASTTIAAPVSSSTEASAPTTTAAPITTPSAEPEQTPDPENGGQE